MENENKALEVKNDVAQPETVSTEEVTTIQLDPAGLEKGERGGYYPPAYYGPPPPYYPPSPFVPRPYVPPRPQPVAYYDTRRDGGGCCGCCGCCIESLLCCTLCLSCINNCCICMELCC